MSAIFFVIDAYLSILSVTIWNKEKGSGKSNNLSLFGTGDAGQQFSTAGDANGYCGTNVDAMDLTATISYDKNFLNVAKSIVLGIFKINGRIKVDGEVGLKCGWGNMGDPNSSGDHANEERCKSGGEILFAIPYAQATLTGELALDLLAVKGGAGVNVIIVKFSLPSTNEEMVDKSCGGVYLKVESLGGKVYAFVDVVTGLRGCGWFCLERTWGRKYEVTLYEWSSPTDWTSNDVTCKSTNGAVTEDTAGGGACTDSPSGWHDSDGASYNCAWYAQGTRCEQYGHSYANQGKTAKQACCACGGGAAGGASGTGSASSSGVTDSGASGVDVASANGENGSSPWVNAQDDPGRCGPKPGGGQYNPNNEGRCGKGGFGCTGTGSDEVCTSFGCDPFRYCSAYGWCGKDAHVEDSSRTQYRCVD